LRPLLSLSFCCVVFDLVPITSAAADSRVIFETGFEAFEGYLADHDLVGQRDWVQDGTGGNGVLAGPIAGFVGQAAYIGFAPPSDDGDAFNVWRPINLVPAGNDQPVFRFTVTFQVEVPDEAKNPPRDDFRWSVYNTVGDRLFSLDLDNVDHSINYVLDDDQGFVPTGYVFDNGRPYDLAITMNLARNLWTAEINTVVVVNAAPITTLHNRLDLGDIDAVWAIRTAGKPGQNFMLFDDYRITGEPVSSIPSHVVPLGVLNGTQFLVRVLGEPGVTYVLEAAGDLEHWTEVGRQTAQFPGGTADFQDAFAQTTPTRFYRAYSVVP
jgi:hypothetical protein